MIRSSKHSIKFTNSGKQKVLSEFINCYKNAMEFYVNYLWNTKIINDTINTAVDKSNALKTDTAKRMSDYRNNLTLNEEQKNEKISSLTKEYRTEKYKLQNDINEALKAASDKAVESATKLQAALKEEQSSAKMKIETMMNS